MEWSKSNQYNSFNSYKGLTYYENYKKIVGWLNGGELPAPIECSLDPIFACNHRCYYCNSQGYLRDNPQKGQLSFKVMSEFIEKLAKWDVRGLCFGGGGESTLNSDVPQMIELAQTRGLEVAMVTNGSQFHDGFLRENLINCRWVGVSLERFIVFMHHCIDLEVVCFLLMAPGEFLFNLLHIQI